VVVEVVGVAGLDEGLEEEREGDMVEAEVTTLGVENAIPEKAYYVVPSFRRVSIVDLYVVKSGRKLKLEVV
jgi:hypothetical protein